MSEGVNDFYSDDELQSGRDDDKKPFRDSAVDVAMVLAPIGALAWIVFALSVGNR